MRYGMIPLAAGLLLLLVSELAGLASVRFAAAALLAAAHGLLFAVSARFTFA